MIEAMTLGLLEKEVLELPPGSRVRLAEKILESIEDYTDSGLAGEWDAEVGRRVRRIKSGAERGIPATQVMKAARRALNEAGRVSSPRSK